MPSRKAQRAKPSVITQSKVADASWDDDGLEDVPLDDLDDLDETKTMQDAEDKSPSAYAMDLSFQQAAAAAAGGASTSHASASTEDDDEEIPVLELGSSRWIRETDYVLSESEQERPAGSSGVMLAALREKYQYQAAASGAGADSGASAKVALEVDAEKVATLSKQVAFKDARMEALVDQALKQHPLLPVEEETRDFSDSDSDSSGLFSPSHYGCKG